MRRQNLLLFAMCTTMMLLFLLTSNHVGYSGSQDYMEMIDNMMLNVSNSTTCMIPMFDLVRKDLEYRKVFQPVRPLTCKHIQPELTFYQNGMLHWNKTLLRQVSVPLTCYASFVSRRAGNDDDISYSEQFLIEPGVDRNLGGSLLRIICYHEANGIRNGIFYNNIHLNLLSAKNNVDKRKIAKPNSKASPSVFILLIESLSRVNAHVQLPKTLSVLAQKYDATFLNGLMKVGDNTFPNLLALLTGLWAGERDGTGSETEEFKGKGDSDRHIDIDRLPFIWKEFSHLGCATLYSEDYPSLNTFNYWRHGFQTPPTDVYHRPFWLAANQLYTQTKTKTKTEGCLLNKPTYTYQFDTAKSFLKIHKNKCTFSLVFHVEHGHTKDINQVSVLDSELASLLAEIHSEGLLKDKLVILGGDHGNRFTWSRTSLGGRFEERMPFMAISLPEEVRRSHPQWQENLENNKEKLISNFDLHLTIKQFLNQSQQAVTPPQSHRSPISVLEPLPSNRTCSEAGVPEYYCVCIPETYLPIHSALVTRAAKTLTGRINNIISPFRNICEAHKLGKILEARRLQSETQRVRLVLETTHGAVFEGLLNSSGEQVIGDINRLDYAGETVACMERDWMQLFCQCRPEEVLDQDLFETEDSEQLK